MDLNIWIPKGIQIRVPEPEVSSDIASQEPDFSEVSSSDISDPVSASSVEDLESAVSSENPSSEIQQGADTAHSEPAE